MLLIVTPQACCSKATSKQIKNNFWTWLSFCLSVTPSDCTQIKWLLSATFVLRLSQLFFWPRDEGSKVDGPNSPRQHYNQSGKWESGIDWCTIWQYVYNMLTESLELHSGTFRRHPKCRPLENQLGYLGSLSKWYNMIELISAWQVNLFHLPVPVHCTLFSFFSYMVL